MTPSGRVLIDKPITLLKEQKEQMLQSLTSTVANSAKGSRNSRISMEELALKLAETAALRSEDPYRKVGTVALTKENRIVALAYNGLLPKMVVSRSFWSDRNRRRKYMVHAEQNLCSLFKRGEVLWVAITCLPCPACLILLASHGVKRIIYRNPYETDMDSIAIAKFYKLKLEEHETL